MSSQFSTTMFGDAHTNWPNDPPKDLELRMLDALSYRSCNQAALWDEIKDWLEENPHQAYGNG